MLTLCYQTILGEVYHPIFLPAVTNTFRVMYTHIFSRLYQNYSVSNGQLSRSFACCPCYNCWCNSSICSQCREWKLLIFDHSDATWAPLGLKSPATAPFVQPFVHTYIKNPSKTRVTGHLKRESTGDQLISPLRASDAEMCPCHDVSSELVSTSVILNELILLFTV